MFPIKGGKEQKLTRSRTAVREMLRMLQDAVALCSAAQTACWLDWLGATERFCKEARVSWLCCSVYGVPVHHVSP